MMFHEFIDNKARRGSRTDAVSTTLVEMHHGLCPFCPLPSELPKTLPSSDRFVQYQIIYSSPKGEAELAWLKSTNLAVDFSADSLQNLLPVCGNHAEMLLQGRIVLCPPIRDLQKLLLWEENDWDRRLHEQARGSPSARSTPRVEELSGNLSCIWITSQAAPQVEEVVDFSITCTWFVETETNPDPTFPQHFLYLRDRRTPQPKEIPEGVVQWSVSTPRSDELIAGDRLADSPLPLFNMEFTFNRGCPGGQLRISPFATIVWALEMLGGAYTPPILFYTERRSKGGFTKPVPMGNPTVSYRKLLRELRRLYSRTDEDLRRECRAMSEGVELSAHARC